MFHQHALRRMSRGEKDETFRNPIIPGFNPDPSIIRVKNDYFLVTSSFEYTPGAPIYHSTDLIQWTLIGHALTRKSQLDIKAPEPGGGVWACTLRYHDGWFYMTTTVWDRYRTQEYKVSERAWPRGFYVKTQDIWNSESWSDPVYFDEPGFDQDLFWDDDGSVYLSTTHRKIDYDPESQQKQLGIHVCKIDLETGNSISPAVLVRDSKVGVGVSEGSHFFKRGKFYYLFTAEGGTESGHSEYCLRSESMDGPWTECPHNPLIHNTTNEAVQNTGHCDFVEDSAGCWWAVCLAVRPLKTDAGWTNSVFGRESFLMPVTWEDDWPRLNFNEPLALYGTGPGLYLYNQPLKWRDNFESQKLSLGWYFKNTAVKPDQDYSLSARPGYLRLYGAPFSLRSPSAPVAVFRKQTFQVGTWRTRISFSPERTNCEAGTVVYWNYFTYSSIGIRRNASGKRQIVTNLVGTVEAVDLESDDSEVDLVIECKESEYHLGFEELVGGIEKRASGTKGNQSVATISTAAMTRDPLAGLPFTGMMLGLYSFGDITRNITPADFRFAEVL